MTESCETHPPSQLTNMYAYIKGILKGELIL